MPPPPEKNVGFDPKKPHMTSIVKCKLKKVDFYQVPTYVLTFFWRFSIFFVDSIVNIFFNLGHHSKVILSKIYKFL